MIKNLDRIVEVKFTNKENPELAAELFQDGNSMGRDGILSVEQVEDESETELSWHVLYVEDKTKLPIYKYGFLGPKKDAVRDLKRELRVFIEDQGAESFTDLLFFLGIASSHDPYVCDSITYNPTIETLPRYKFKPNPVVDDLLKDTRGLILWKHQLRSLLNLFSGDPEWIKNMAKDVYGGSAGDVEGIREFKFADGLRCSDVIEERTLMWHVVEPPIREAYILFNALRGNTYL